jgi:hypothetical protein
VLLLDEEKYNGQRRERGSIRSTQRSRGVFVVEAERWRRERGKIRGRSSNKSLKVLCHYATMINNGTCACRLDFDKSGAYYGVLIRRISGRI